MESKKDLIMNRKKAVFLMTGPTRNEEEELIVGTNYLRGRSKGK